MFWEGLLSLALELQQKHPSPALPFAYGEREGAKLCSLPLAQPRGGLGRGKLFKQRLTSN